MSERKIERGEAVWSGVMVGIWLAVAAAGVWRASESLAEGEVSWIGIIAIAMSSAWIARNAIKLIDYVDQK